MFDSILKSLECILNQWDFEVICTLSEWKCNNSVLLEPCFFFVWVSLFYPLYFLGEGFFFLLWWTFNWKKYETLPLQPFCILSILPFPNGLLMSISLFLWQSFSFVPPFLVKQITKDSVLAPHISSSLKQKIKCIKRKAFHHS